MKQQNGLKHIFDTLDPLLDGASVKYEHYLDIYNQEFKDIRHDKLNILEIGIEKGGSLSLWDKFFTNKETTIVGIDIVPGCKSRQRNKIKVEIGDQTDLNFLSSLNKYGKFDIVIDDGGHHINEHIIAFNYIFNNLLNNKGLYFIEDLHTCYMPEFKGGIDKNTFMDAIGGLIHHPTIQNKEILNINEDYFGLIDNIKIYNSLVVITKQQTIRNKITSNGFSYVPYPI